MFNVGTKAINSDFINFDEMILDQKIMPEMLELPIPRYMKENEGHLVERDDLID